MSEFDFTAFVKSLSKQQLETLVLEFAPESYREEVRYRQLDGSDAKLAFDKVAKKIRALFDDVDLLYEPSDFEASLIGLTEKLAGFWDRFPEETGELLLFCIKKIDESQEDGFLYNQYYDDIYDGSSFLALIQRFAASLSFDQKLVFLDKLEPLLSNYAHDTFSGYGDALDGIFSESDIPLLKASFLGSVSDERKPFRTAYYHFLKDSLDLQERERVLEQIYHLDKRLCLELVDVLEAQKKPGVAVAFLESLRQANANPMVFGESLFIRLLQLRHAAGKPLRNDILEGLRVYRTDSLLELGIGLEPEGRLAFEEALKDGSHYHFLKYLLRKERIEEAHQLVMQSKTLDGRSEYDFFAKYCKKFPEDATRFFVSQIERELQYTGDAHYEAIVAALGHIRAVNPAKAQEITDMLRREYKRRRNLMAMLG
jgi:hypothetical protein